MYNQSFCNKGVNMDNENSGYNLEKAKEIMERMANALDNLVENDCTNQD
jgi:hypothetical protein